jgi:predicted AlkP superfamily pyrophosphatase or phosphodiesterase
MMKSFCFLFLLLATQLTAQTPKAVFIIIDGVPADVIEKLDLPSIREISKTGGYTRAHQGGDKNNITKTPTISAPGYYNVLTGVWGYKHNVWDNDIAAPNYNYWNIFRIARVAKPTLKLGIFSTWEDNRTKLIGEGLPAAGALSMDYKFDGLEKDTVTYPHDNVATHIKKIDEAVTNEATRTIREQGPDLSWVYLEFTDDMGHKYGDSPQFYEAVKAADRQIGKIWAAIKEREKNMNEDWCIIVTTDHGRTIENGKHHGGQSDRERTTWIATNAKHLNASFNDNPGAVDILPTLCRHLGIVVPDTVGYELDGVPFNGVIELSHLQAIKQGDKVVLTWKNISSDKDTQFNILASSTNHFKTGTSDVFKSVGTVLANAGKFEFKSKEKFLKVVVKGNDQTAAVWVTMEEK